MRSPFFGKAKRCALWTHKPALLLQRGFACAGHASSCGAMEYRPPAHAHASPISVDRLVSENSNEVFMGLAYGRKDHPKSAPVIIAENNFKPKFYDTP